MHMGVSLFQIAHQKNLVVFRGGEVYPQLGPIQRAPGRITTEGSYICRFFGTGRIQDSFHD